MTGGSRRRMVDLFALGAALALSFLVLGLLAPASPFTGKLLMAFHACDAGSGNGCYGPESNSVFVVQSNDGWGWSLVPGIEPFQGGVPDIIRRGNTIYVYYLTFGFGNPPEILRVRKYDVETGALRSKARVKVTHSDGRKESIVDPNLVIDDDGCLVLFYLVQDVGLNDPALCKPGTTRCTKLFRSATEVDGSEGTVFVVDPGNRYEQEIGAHEILADPDVFRGPDGYVMYLGYVDERSQSTYPDVTLALSSAELRGTYRFVAGLRSGVLARGVSGGPTGVYDPAAQRYWTYGTRVAQDVSLIIAGATHPTLDSEIRESGIRTALSGGGLPGLGRRFWLASPGIAPNVASPEEAWEGISPASGTGSSSAGSSGDEGRRDP